MSARWWSVVVGAVIEEAPEGPSLALGADEQAGQRGALQPVEAAIRGVGR
jgi:hypothetical protein